MTDPHLAHPEHVKEVGPANHSQDSIQLISWNWFPLAPPPGPERFKMNGGFAHLCCLQQVSPPSLGAFLVVPVLYGTLLRVSLCMMCALMAAHPLDDLPFITATSLPRTICSHYKWLLVT